MDIEYDNLKLIKETPTSQRSTPRENPCTDIERIANDYFLKQLNRVSKSFREPDKSRLSRGRWSKCGEWFYSAHPNRVTCYAPLKNIYPGNLADEIGKMYASWLTLRGYRVKIDYLYNDGWFSLHAHFDYGKHKVSIYEHHVQQA